MASGNMGQTLTQKNNVFVSADAGLSWHQVLKGSYFYNLGDHGGIIVAVKYFKTEGPTRELLYSTDEGLNWKSLNFYDKPLRVYGNTLKNTNRVFQQNGNRLNISLVPRESEFSLCMLKKLQASLIS